MEYALITGATSGIGYELARQFARHGYGLILVSSSAQRLEQAKKRLEGEYPVPITLLEQDLSQAGAAKRLCERLADQGACVDILVNNAGFGLVGRTEEIDPLRDGKMMALNMAAPVELTKLLLPDMLRRRRGRILNVASTGAFQPGPYTATYFASKAFLLSYTRAVRREAMPRGVQVCALCPGTTRTQFFQREGVETPPWAMSAEKTARIAFRGLMAGREVIVPGLGNRLLRLLPLRLRIWGVARMKGRK